MLLAVQFLMLKLLLPRVLSKCNVIVLYRRAAKNNREDRLLHFGNYDSRVMLEAIRYRRTRIRGDVAVNPFQ